MGTPKKITLIFLRACFIVVPFAVFLWLLYKDFIVPGVLFAEYDFVNKSPFITALRPQSRIGEVEQDPQGVHYQRVFDEPIYFDVRMPRLLDTAEVTLTYKNIDQPVIEMGAMADPDLWSFDLKPVENFIIEFLLQDKLRWTQVREGDTMLFERGKKFNTINEFLKNLPSREKIATYNYKIVKDFILQNYIRYQEGIMINKTLRGGQRMYVYAKSEPLDFEIWIQDVNRHEGDDYVSIDIYDKDNASIYSNFIKLDNDAANSRKMSEVRKEHIAVADPGEGAYRIELTTPSDDIFFRRISTKLSYLVFMNKVYLGDNVGYSDEFDEERMRPTLLYADGKSISAITTHIEGLQTLLINDSALKVNDTHAKYSSLMNFTFKKIVIPKNDITIETKGMIAFSQKNFFNPEFMSLSDGSEFNRDSVQYVMTSYSEGKVLGDGWRQTTLHFDISKYYTLDSKLHFVVSLPYLEKENKGILISNISVTMRGSPMTIRQIGKRIENKIKELFNM